MRLFDAWSTHDGEKGTRVRCGKNVFHIKPDQGKRIVAGDCNPVFDPEEVAGRGAARIHAKDGMRVVLLVEGGIPGRRVLGWGSADEYKQALREIRAAAQKAPAATLPKQAYCHGGPQRQPRRYPTISGEIGFAAA